MIFIRIISVALAIGGFITNGSGRPNIIYILADDLGYADVGCYGGKVIQTPRIDQMREEGMLFSQHYSGSTVCAPTRCVLMTGLHTGHAHIRGNGGPGLRNKDITIAKLLQKAGYRTAAIGKWGLGGPGSDGVPNKQGFDYWFGYLSQSRAHHYYPPFLWRNQQKIHYPNNPEMRTHYSHDLFTREALEFIERNTESPFFLYLAYTIPHVDLDVPDDSIEPYLSKIKEKGPYGKPGGQHYRHTKQPRATFAGMVSRLDRDVGRLLDKLDKLQISKNTVVIFSSDNGPTSAGGADPDYFDGNGQFRGIKRDLYEGGIRVPMIVKWPGKVSMGSTSSHISAHWDVMSTLAELSELPVNHLPKTDGISFVPTLLGTGNQKKHDYLYWEFFEKGGKQAIRMGKWKGVKLGLKNNKNALLELYDLDSDPSESNDLNQQYPDIVNELENKLANARTESTFFSWENKKRKTKAQ